MTRVSLPLRRPLSTVPLRRLLHRRGLVILAAVLLAAAAVQAIRPAPVHAEPTVSFGVAGDLGGNGNTAAVLDSVAGGQLQGFFALGDLSYSEVTPESAWCDLVTSRVGTSFPYQLVAGNHEDDGPDGLISNFAACLPDKLGVQGDYPREYYVDYPPTSPLVRFIMISPKLTFPPSTKSWSYSASTSHYAWTADAIDSARAAGIPWVVVGMHMYCLSLVNYPCATGTDIMNLMFAKKVDVYLQAHDHGYARSKQLALNGTCTEMPTTSYNPDCVADGNVDSAYTAGNGTVLATVGMGGRALNKEHPELAQGQLFQASMGSNANATFGYLRLDVSAGQLAARFERGSGGSYTDSFTLTKPLASPPPTGSPTPSPTDSPTPSPSPTATSPSPSPTDSPTPSPTATSPSPSSTSSLYTLTADADSFVQSDSPTATHGSDTALYVDSSPTKITYLKFDTSALSGKTLVDATLRFTTTSSNYSGSPDTQDVHVVADSSWTESGLNYSNMPTPGSAIIGSLSNPASNTTYDVVLDPTQLQSLLGGELSLALDSTGGAGDAFYINSREVSINQPQLLLTAG